MTNRTILETCAFTSRNVRLFFKDKGTLISALIAPLILLFLYVMFLHNTLVSGINLDVDIDLSSVLKGYVAAYEVSSILAVCSVTVAFTANMSMVNDRVSGVYADIAITPARRTNILLGYFFATFLITCAICFVTLGVGSVYMACMGWHVTVGDFFASIADVVMGSLFGTALSSVVVALINSRGAINAVTTIVSAAYGFICGAYYPISQFSAGVANFVMCLPGTYCTALFRSHLMGGYAQAFMDIGAPSEATNEIMRSLDTQMSFFGTQVANWAAYLVVGLSVIALVFIYILINYVITKKQSGTKNHSVHSQKG